MLFTMSKREHESNDFDYSDSGRPLKRLRLIEADIGSLPDEVIEKILLLIPTHYMLGNFKIHVNFWRQITQFIFARQRCFDFLSIY